MGIKIPDISIGSRFGNRVVIDGPRRAYQGQKQYLCECSCGYQCWIFASELLRGKKQLCVSCTHFKHGHTAGGKPSAEYRAWRHLIARCYNPSHIFFQNYGGRGITVSPQWLGESGFTNFLNDVGPRPSSKHSIDRVDNDGNYEPSNVRWATREENSGNKRNCITVTYQGVTHCIAAWARELGVSDFKVRHRIKAGMPIEQVVAELTGSK